MRTTDLVGIVNDPPIAVIGLGYVGLPLAAAFAHHRAVVGYDTNRNRIEALRGGNDCTREVSKQELELLGDRITFTYDKSHLNSCGVFIITVPTPVDKHNAPDLSCLRAACETVGKCMSRGALIVIESTVYPGCTEEVCIPILERTSGRTVNKEFHVGYSPERVNPGDQEHTLTKINKVVSGSDNESRNRTALLYAKIMQGHDCVYSAPSIRVAEAAKAIENAQRDINIAFVNELAMIFGRMGIDTQEVLKAAGTKWNFLPFLPGLVGGHCIGVDPYYLAHKAKEYGYQPQVILSGRSVNESVAPYIAQKLVKKMRKLGYALPPHVLVMGVTFKENCPDIRNSKSMDIVTELEEFGCKTTAYDPVAGLKTTEREIYETMWDGIVVAVAHDEFRKIDFARLKSLGPNTILFDVKGIVPRELADLRL